MNLLVSKKNSALLCLLLVILSIMAVFGGTNTKTPESQIPEFVKRQQRVRAARKERLAYEAYEKRNAEITPWVEDNTPLKQCNGALLYYQAFILQPDLDLPTSQKISKFLRGGQADRQVRTYLGHCLPTLEMAEIASRVPQCSWGVRYLQMPGYDKKFLSLSVHRLQTILTADARILAAEGHYRVALERCLTVRRFARHLSEDPKLKIISGNSNLAALLTIQHVLGIMPPDEEILTWFRGQLAVVEGRLISYAEILQADFKSYFNNVLMNPDSLKYMRGLLVENAENEQAKQNALNLTDEQILSRFEPFPSFLNSIFRILDSGMTYEQKCTKIQLLIDKLIEEEGTDPLVAEVIVFSGIDTMIKPPSRYYPFYVDCQAHINGIKAAVEIYLVIAKTGQLPKTLPDGLPKDPFTGRDFIYEITDEGFTLRCQGEEFLRRKNKYLEFKVKK